MASNDSYYNAYNHPPTGPPTVSHPMSPYLAIDPSIFKTEPQYIMPEGASPRRGRFEYAFSQIGGSVMLGSLIGGTQGMLTGLTDKTMTDALMSKARRTHVLNAAVKYSTSTAGALGVIALLYSGIGTGLSLSRGADDDFNTVAAGALTGLLYKSPGGLRKAGIGGAVGACLAVAYCLITKQDLTGRILNKISPSRFV